MKKVVQSLRTVSFLIVCSLFITNLAFAKADSLMRSLLTRKALADQKVRVIQKNAQVKIAALNNSAKKNTAATKKKFKGKAAKKKIDQIKKVLLVQVQTLKRDLNAKIAKIVEPIKAEQQVITCNKALATPLQIKAALVLKQNGVAVNKTSIDMGSILNNLSIPITGNNITVASHLHNVKPAFDANDFTAARVLSAINPVYNAADLNTAVALHAIKPAFDAGDFAVAGHLNLIKPNFNANDFTAAKILSAMNPGYNAADLNTAVALHAIKPAFDAGDFATARALHLLKPAFNANDFAAAKILSAMNPGYNAADLNTAVAIHAIKPAFDAGDFATAKALHLLKPAFDANDFAAAVRFNAVRGLAPLDSFNLNQINAGTRLITNGRRAFTNLELTRAVHLYGIHAAFTANNFDAATQLNVLGQVINHGNVNAGTKLVELAHGGFNVHELTAANALLGVKPNPIWQEIDDLSRYTGLAPLAFNRLTNATAVASRALNQYYPQLMAWLDANANDVAAGGGFGGVGAPARNAKNLGQDGYRWESILDRVGKAVGNNRVGGHAGLSILTLEEARRAENAIKQRLDFIHHHLVKDLQNDGIAQNLADFRACHKTRLSTTIANIGNGMRRDEKDLPCIPFVGITSYESSRVFQKINFLDEE